MKEFLKNDKLRPVYLGVFVVMIAIELITKKVYPVFHAIASVLMASVSARYIASEKITWNQQKTPFIAIAVFLYFALQSLLEYF